MRRVTERPDDRRTNVPDEVPDEQVLSPENSRSERVDVRTNYPDVIVRPAPPPLGGGVPDELTDGQAAGERERADWEGRLRAAVAETLRQRAARRRLREQHQAARDIGLRHRHAARLARARGDAMPTTDAPRPPCCRDSGHPDGCPQHAQHAWEADRRRLRRRSHRCVLCPAAAGPAMAGAWTWRALAEPVVYRSVFGDLPDTPAGDYAVCPACSAWLADPNRAEKPLPDGVADRIAGLVDAAGLHPQTARRLRAELVGAARHLAEQLQPT